MIKKMLTRTVKAKEDIWLFADGNNQTHTIIPKGNKMKVYIDNDYRFGRVYASKCGYMLSATLNENDLKQYGLVKE